MFRRTRLNEPPMYHYLAMRSERSKGTSEVRAKAFVVTPSVSAIRGRQLQDQGFCVIQATAEDFGTTQQCRESEQEIEGRFRRGPGASMQSITMNGLL